MSLRLLGAVVADGLRGVMRGRGLALAAVVVIGLTFSGAAVILLAAESLSTAVRAWSRPGAIRVTMEEYRSVSDAEVLAGNLRQLAGVDSVTTCGRSALAGGP